MTARIGTDSRIWTHRDLLRTLCMWTVMSKHEKLKPSMKIQDWSFLRPWPRVGRTALQAGLNIFKCFIFASTDAPVTCSPFLLLTLQIKLHSQNTSHSILNPVLAGMKTQL